MKSGTDEGPPDTNGDVGPNHYIQSVNESYQVFDKSGKRLTPAITFNSFFAPLGNSTPCGANQNQSDPVIFYDQIADRWVITNVAFPAISRPLILGMHRCFPNR